MRLKLRMLQVAQLVLALVIATQDVTAGKDDSTKDRLFLQNQYGNKRNSTEYYRSLELEEGDWTAGNTKCRSDHACGYYQSTTYTYCYVDYSNNWDYCCTGPCDFHGKNYMWCQAASGWQYCGDAGYIPIDLTSCYYLHKCGMHQEIGKKGYYWCYIDHNLNWRKCCAPSSSCDYHGYPYRWCYTGNTKETLWEYCK